MKKTLLAVTIIAFFLLISNTVSAYDYVICDSASTAGTTLTCNFTANRGTSTGITQAQIDGFWTSIPGSITHVIWRVSNAQIDMAAQHIYFRKNMATPTWDIVIDRTSGYSFFRNYYSGFTMDFTSDVRNITIDGHGSDRAYLQGYNQSGRKVNIDISGELLVQGDSRIINPETVKANMITVKSGGRINEDNRDISLQTIRLRVEDTTNNNWTILCAGNGNILTNKIEIQGRYARFCGSGSRNLTVNVLAGNSYDGSIEINSPNHEENTIYNFGNITAQHFRMNGGRMINISGNLTVQGDMTLNDADLHYLNRDNRGAGIIVGNNLHSTNSDIHFNNWGNVTVNGTSNEALTIIGKRSSYALYRPAGITVPNGGIKVDNGSGGAGTRLTAVIWGQRGRILAKGDIYIRGVEWDGSDTTGITEVTSQTGRIYVYNSYLRSVQGPITAATDIRLKNSGRTDRILGDNAYISLRATDIDIDDARIYDVTHSAINSPFTGAGTIIATNSINIKNSTFPDSHNRDMYEMRANYLTLDNTLIFVIRGGKLEGTTSLTMQNSAEIQYMGDNGVTASPILAGNFTMSGGSKINSANAGGHMVGNITANVLDMSGDSRIHVLAGDITLNNYLKMTDSQIRFYDNIGTKWEQKTIKIGTGDKSANSGKAIYISGGQTYDSQNGTSIATYQSHLNIMNEDWESDIEMNNTLINAAVSQWKDLIITSCKFTGSAATQRSSSFTLITKEAADQSEISKHSSCGSNCTPTHSPHTCASGATGTCTMSANPITHDSTAFTSNITVNFQNLPSGTTTVDIGCGNGTSQTAGIISSSATATCSYAENTSTFKIYTPTATATGVAPCSTSISHDGTGGPGSPGSPIATKVFINAFIVDDTSGVPIRGTITAAVAATTPEIGCNIASQSFGNVTPGLIEAEISGCELIPGSSHVISIIIHDNATGNDETTQVIFTA